MSALNIFIHVSSRPLFLFIHRFTEKYHGAANACGTIVGCILLGLPGLLCLLVPCDERKVYIVNGAVFTADGQIIRFLNHAK